MKKTLIAWVVLTAASLPASADQGQKPRFDLPGRPVNAKDYSSGVAGMLRGEVLAVSEDQMSVWDWNADDAVTVEVADDVLMTGIEPGDKVRVLFAKDGKEATKVIEETY